MSLSIPVPTINANDETVLVVRWLVADGARVAAGEGLVDVETTKSVVTIDSPAAGVLKQCAKEGAEIAVGAEIARLDGVAGVVAEPDLTTPKKESVGEAAPVSMAPVPQPVAAPVGVPETSGQGGAPRLSTAAAKLAAERGLDPAAPFPGAAGLVTARRLQAALGESAAVTKTAAPASSVGRRDRTPSDKRAEIAALREGATGGLRSSLTMYFDSAPVRAVLGAGSGLLGRVLAEAARLVAARPAFAAWHEDGATIYYDAVHLGVAIDLGEGLRVAVLRDADKASADELESRLAERVLDCAERRLTPLDSSGSTFTVTDLSALDVLHFEPLINGRQSAILAVGGDSRLPGWPMSLTLAFDHRVLTGRQVAEFLRDLRGAIEAIATGGAATTAIAVTAEVAESASAPASAFEASSEPPACDRCGVEVGDYYARFGRAGLMQNYTRADGSTGRICHACVALG